MMKIAKLYARTILLRTLRRHYSLTVALFILFFMLRAGGFAQNPGQFVATDAHKEALGRISADSLRGHLSFLAADLLDGRNTPSEGLDVAAEYIAAQYRRAGLKPIEGGDFFQTVPGSVSIPKRDEFRFSLKIGERSVDVAPENFQMTAIEPLRIDGAAVAKIPYREGPLNDALEVKGQVILTEFHGEPESPAGRLNYDQGRRRFMSELSSLEPLLIVVVDRHIQGGFDYFSTPRLERRGRGTRPGRTGGQGVSVSGDGIIEAFDAMPTGLTEAKLWMMLKAPIRKEIPLRNVVGLLEGSDPVLKDSYILLTAHYDGTGPRQGAAGEDKIWNAANDNASGTATVMEVAAALSRLTVKPRRSLVFVAFYGEEKGLLGSRHYADHPVFPLDKTVACVNLEQLGRTDSNQGDQTNRASLTGFDFSDIGQIFRAAGMETGIDVYKDELKSDAYFNRSDNMALAMLGVPAHTLCVAYAYGDYHGPADHWEKIDYQNLARTNRMIALALLRMAESDDVPRWNAGNPRALKYLKAWQKMHPE